ncbi:MAG: hypothetical protein JF593_14140 [Novosphingobium sp.]|nr:hypothetical protein [Novosphingobium sp.]
MTDELNTILTMLQKACPASALISFDFDGELHVHLDVRNREEVMLIQATLPLLGMGLFKNVSLGGTPHRPFYHRITALVAR